ncbi:glycosyltransferase family 2 protein [Flavobacterium ginsengiterrae]|uniref:Glycosyltransferase family 2 protein n=1 Tax=Flavobacterium ginsengiterrae TaxID=871695 RepID=A0ABP7H6P8_9FLAO
MNPLISIIIPTYNRAYIIEETLSSIGRQTYTNWECIIVDDGSTDNTEELLLNHIQKDNRFKYFKRSENYIKGPNSCRNLGYKFSQGEYIKWFDSDDIMSDFCLQQELNHFKNDTQVVISPLLLYDFTNNKVIKESNVFSENLIYDYFIGKISLYVSGPIWKNSFLKNQQYLFDEKVSNVDDWDFNMRMLYEKPVIVFNEKPGVLYRVHENSLSQEIVKGNLQEILSIFNALQKHLSLIKSNKITTYKPLLNYTLNYYKERIYFSLVQKQKYSFLLYKKAVKLHFFELYDFTGFLKLTLGYLMYTFFSKGYKFFRTKNI